MVPENIQNKWPSKAHQGVDQKESLNSLALQPQRSAKQPVLHPALRKTAVTSLHLQVTSAVSLAPSGWVFEVRKDEE